ncbi:MAG: hypothetical protein HGA37_10000 [Lentimicrobium sp.]|nr:hypothetical protein [Lentimicrobium sp.]
MKKALLNTIFAWDSLLVLSVFLCAFVIPVLPPSWGKPPLRIGFTLIFLSGVFIIKGKKNLMILYLVLAAFAMEWVSQVLDLDYIADISRALNIVFFYIVIISLFREMARSKIVTARVVLFSISGYILMGIIYSMLIAAIIQHDPDAFNIVHEVKTGSNATAYLSESMYFGFVTLASLGYGDILPLKPYTRSLSTLITISGQLYVATVIGMMIGKYVSGNDKKEVDK